MAVHGLSPYPGAGSLNLCEGGATPIEGEYAQIPSVVLEPRKEC